MKKIYATIICAIAFVSIASVLIAKGDVLRWVGMAIGLELGLSEGVFFFLQVALLNRPNLRDNRHFMRSLSAFAWLGFWFVKIPIGIGRLFRKKKRKAPEVVPREEKKETAKK